MEVRVGVRTWVGVREAVALWLGVKVNAGVGERVENIVSVMVGEGLAVGFTGLAVQAVKFTSWLRKIMPINSLYQG